MKKYAFYITALVALLILAAMLYFGHRIYKQSYIKSTQVVPYTVPVATTSVTQLIPEKLSSEEKELVGFWIDKSPTPNTKQDCDSLNWSPDNCPKYDSHELDFYRTREYDDYLHSRPDSPGGCVWSLSNSVITISCSGTQYETDNIDSISTSTLIIDGETFTRILQSGT